MASTLLLIGWDEVRCRPIYRSIPKSARSTKLKKLKVKITTSGGGGAGARDGQACIAASTAVFGEEALSSLGNAKGGKYGQPGAGKAFNKRRRARTISLSPLKAAGKKVSWGDHRSAISVVAGGNSTSLAVEEEAIKNARDSTTSITYSRKRKKGYGTKTSSASVAASSLIKWGGCKNAEFAPSNYSDEAMESTVIQTLPSLLEESGVETVLECSDGNNDLIPVNDEMIGTDASIQNRLLYSPSNSSVNFDSNCENEKASQSSDEREISSGVSAHSSRLSYSPNPNGNFGSYQHNEQPIQQSPMQDSGSNVNEDENINSRDSMEDEVPVANSSISTPSKVQGQLSPPTSIDTQCVNSTPNSGIGQRKSESNQQHSPGFDSTIDTPLSNSSVNFDSNCENEKASQSLDEKEIGSGVSAHSSRFSYSPNSNGSFDSYQHNEEPIQQSPMQDRGSNVSEDENINSRDSMEDVVPVANSSLSTPSKVQGQLSPPTSIDTQCANRTPNSGIGQRKLESNQQHSPGFDSTIDTPLSKGEESPICPDSNCAKMTFYADEFADFDVTFDESESRALPKEKRRSYGDVKPVWTSNKCAAANSTADASDGSAKVGWDDAKCRMTYKAAPARNTQSQESPDSCSPANTGNVSRIHNKRTQKKRVYASLFKKTGLSQADRDKMEIDSPFAARAPDVPSVVESRRRLAMSSIENSKCDDFAKKASKSGVEEAAIDSDRKRNDTLLNVDLEMEAISNDSNTRRAQPTSKTSLESARAFFRYLDSNHNLTILDRSGEPTQKTKSGVICTKRKIEGCEQLRVQC